jgi:drug/metabolite transporter (DMT)-like permease
LKGGPIVLKIIAVVLIVAGVLALVYGGFSYTKKTHAADLGPIEFAVKEKERINIPLWAGIGVIAAGVLLLLVPGKKS